MLFVFTEPFSAGRRDFSISGQKWCLWRFTLERSQGKRIFQKKSLMILQRFHFSVIFMALSEKILYSYCSIFSFFSVAIVLVDTCKNLAWLIVKYCWHLFVVFNSVFYLNFLICTFDIISQIFYFKQVNCLSLFSSAVPLREYVRLKVVFIVIATENLCFC